MSTVHAFNTFNMVQALVDEARQDGEFIRLVTYSKINNTDSAHLTVEYDKQSFVIYYIGKSEKPYNVHYVLGGKRQTFETSSVSTIMKFVMAMLLLDNKTWK